MPSRILFALGTRKEEAARFSLRPKPGATEKV